MRRFHAPSVLLGFLTVGISLVTSEDQGCQHGSDASTALWSAAKSGDFQKVQGLLQCCADPSYYSKTGSRALHEAAFNGHIPTIKLLMKYGADPNSKKTDGWAPIHLAIRKEINAVAVVKELLHGGAEVNLVTSGPSFTVYDIARNVQMSPAVMDFLRANGGLALHEIAAKSSRDARPYSGSRLHLAARYGDTTAVRDLLKCPEMAKQVSAVDSAGAMPIHEAAFRGFADIVEALLESGADPNARKADGWAAIHLAVRPQIHPVPVLLALIEHGADIDLKTKEGLTAEQMAKQYPGVCESTKTFLSLEGLRKHAGNTEKPSGSDPDHSTSEEDSEKNSTSEKRKINNNCVECICKFRSGCDLEIGCSKGLCGPFQISEGYWKKSGSLKGDFLKCANNLACAKEAIRKFAGSTFAQDCNGDGVLSCADHALLLKNRGLDCTSDEASKKKLYEDLAICEQDPNADLPLDLGPFLRKKQVSPTG